MGKTANLCMRIEPDVKQQAEEILSRLGIPASSAINLFYRQIIMRRGLPFDLTVPENVVCIDDLSKERLDVLLKDSVKKAKKGKKYSVDEAFKIATMRDKR